MNYLIVLFSVSFSSSSVPWSSLSDNASPRWIEDQQRIEAASEFVRERMIVYSDLASPRLFDSPSYVHDSLVDRFARVSLLIEFGGRRMNERVIVDSSVALVAGITLHLGIHQPVRVTVNRYGVGDEPPVHFQSFISPPIVSIPEDRMFFDRATDSDSLNLLPCLIVPRLNTSPEFIAVSENATIDRFCEPNSFAAVPIVDQSSNGWVVSASVSIVEQEPFTNGTVSGPPQPFAIKTASLYDYIPENEYALLMRDIQECGCRIGNNRIVGCDLECLPFIVYELWNEDSIAVHVYLFGEDYMVGVDDGSFHFTIRPQLPGQPGVIGSNILQNIVVMFGNRDSIGFCDPL